MKPIAPSADDVEADRAKAEAALDSLAENSLCIIQHHLDANT